MCRQIAEGVEAAHEKGIIHRDLKPANIKITPEGKVKVLDFGLAKAFQEEMAAADASHSLTLTDQITRPGVILGTAAYMSPEQASGKSVDKRADIWAFGCILYETLTGKMPFKGETVTETIAKVLEGTPDWGALPTNAPLIIRILLRLCLRKNPGSRLWDISDAKFEIAEALDQPLMAETDVATKPILFHGILTAIGATTIVMALLGFGIFLYLQPDSPGRLPRISCSSLDTAWETLPMSLHAATPRWLLLPMVKTSFTAALLKAPRAKIDQCSFGDRSAN